MDKKKSLVALAYGEDVQADVTRVFDLMGGVCNMIEKGCTVVLKPNAGHAAPPESSVCTSPAVVRAVIREVKKAEPKRIIIAEAAAIGCDTMECFKASGIQAVAEEEGVELIDIKREKDLINVPVRGYRSNISHVKLPRFLLEAEHIINLPILKAHASMVFSCALKNIKGVVQDKVHIDMHQQNLTMAMMDVWWAVRADINIVDAINAAAGYSPHTPVPEYIGCVLGSKDPVAADRIACRLSGIDPEYVDYFRVAAQVGMGAAADEDIEVVGDRWEDHKINMWVPYLAGLDSWPEYDIRYENACSSCQALLALNMERVKAYKNAYEENRDLRIVVGRKPNGVPHDIPDEKYVFHGNCTKALLKDHPNALFVPGCPPAEIELSTVILTRHEFNPSLMPTYPEELQKKIVEIFEYIEPAWQQYVYDRADEWHAAHGGGKVNRVMHGGERGFKNFDEDEK